jgi:hypothetical protein
MFQTEFSRVLIVQNLASPPDDAQLLRQMLLLFAR